MENKYWKTKFSKYEQTNWLNSKNFNTNNIISCKLKEIIKPNDFFDVKTGEYLGKGDTNDIKFISKDDWERGNLSNTVRFASSQVEIKVLEYYFKLFDVGSQIKSENYQVIFKPSNNGWGQDYTKVNGKDILTTNFDYGDIGNLIKNKYDAYMIMKHEIITHGNDHMLIGGYDGNDSVVFWTWEKRATHKEIYSKYWGKTSKGYKQWTYDAYGKVPFVLPVNKRQQYFGKYGVKIN